MYHLVLLFAAAALLSSECRSANVNRHMKMLNQIDNTIQASVLPTNKRSAYRKVVNITGRPGERVAHPSGTIVQLTCEAIGAPAPSIRWFKNDAPVYEHDIESNELIDSNPSSLARVSSTLLIRRTEGEDLYTCLAVAGPKTMKAASTVYSTNGATSVSERTKLFPLEPHIVTSYSMYMDIIGSNIVIPCRAKGHPKPHIAWTDNNGNAVKNNPRMKVLRSGELVISPLRWVDMGEYKCEATNAFGSQIATTFVYPAKAG